MIAAKPADNPQVHVGANAARPGLVLFAVGSGTNPFSITPERADEIAAQLFDSADAARAAGGVRE